MKRIEIVAAVILDSHARMLLVRKRGSTVFIQPGGKPEPGEAPLAALTRELREELGVEIRDGSATSLGTFEDVAVNEPGCRVRAQAWHVDVAGTIAPRAEIEACAWVPLDGPAGLPVAPLTLHHLIPAVVAHLRAAA